MTTNKAAMKAGSRVKYATRRRNSHTLRVAWESDEQEDGRRPASDPMIVLHGQRRRKTPRLKRQEAFSWPPSDIDEAESYYRLGISYDDDQDSEHVRRSSFRLNAVMHSEREHSARPTKRVKRSPGHEFPWSEEDLYHSVELLSTLFGDDAAVTRCLIPANDEHCTEIYHGDLNCVKGRHIDWAAPERLRTPLAVIYELDESSVQSLESIPAANDYPDLVSDTEDER